MGHFYVLIVILWSLIAVLLILIAILRFLIAVLPILIAIFRFYLQATVQDGEIPLRNDKAISSCPIESDHPV
jgi:hypothetical protein